jgi:hypothetical protein
MRSDGLGHGESDSVLLRIVRSLLDLSMRWARKKRCAPSTVTFLTRHTITSQGMGWRLARHLERRAAATPASGHQQLANGSRFGQWQKRQGQHCQEKDLQALNLLRVHHAGESIRLAASLHRGLLRPRSASGRCRVAPLGGVERGPAGRQQ